MSDYFYSLQMLLRSAHLTFPLPDPLIVLDIQDENNE